MKNPKNPINVLVESTSKDIKATLELRGIIDPDSLEAMDTVSEVAVLQALIVYLAVCADNGLPSGLNAFVEAVNVLKHAVDEENASTR